MSTFILFSPSNGELIVQSEVRPPATKPPEGVPSPRKIRALLAGPATLAEPPSARTLRPLEAVPRGPAELTKLVPISPLGAPSSRIVRSQRALKLPPVTSLAQATKLPAGSPEVEPFAKRTYSAWATKEFSHGSTPVLVRAGADFSSLEEEYAARLHRVAEVQQRTELRQAELARERRNAKLWQKRQRKLRAAEKRRLAAEQDASALEQERLKQLRQAAAEQESAEEAEEKRKLFIEKKRLMALQDMRKRIKGRVTHVEATVPDPASPSSSRRKSAASGRRASSFGGQISTMSRHSVFSGRRVSVTEAVEESDGELESIDERGSPAMELDLDDVAASKFDRCMHLSRKYDKPVSFIKRCMEDFSQIDEDGNGEISKQEFQNAVARMCDLPEGQRGPEHLTTRLIQMLLNHRKEQMDADADFAVTFEDYLLWYISSTFSEELSGTSAQEKSMRQIARDTGIPLPEIERMKKYYDKFDTDGSGDIDKEEFFAVLCSVLNVKNPDDLSQQMLLLLGKSSFRALPNIL
eukprot:TRINITY_DN14173_c0_g1_i2.p1 TRINITY_DN14173_c0_g1~~TRINITY_DN14173_c0_g1_i2.p1  ORF type:complete len:524 (-),score=124.48 TRINITY_DN14173_c0_g1_i2:204-1775(-)